MSTSSEKPLCSNGGFARISHGTHGLAGQDLHATESDNANATGGRHPGENDYDPVQTAYVPKKEAAQPTLEDNFALGEEVPHRASEGVRDNSGRPGVNFNHDATSGQRELERLVASVRSVQREEAAARLPPAAQRSSVPGLAPADSGFGPPRWWEIEDLTPSPAMGWRPDRLRGPFTVMFTIIKISTLIVSIIAAPAAYYFWVGDRISNLPPQRAPFAPNSMPRPMPPSQAATTIARDDDPGTPAKGEPRTAKSFADVAQGEPRTPKSFAGETVATLQPSAPGAQQQDADDLPRLGETAAEYQARLSRTQGERAAQREAQTPIPAPRPAGSTDRTAVEVQTPIPAAAAASPTATTDRTAVAPVLEQNVTSSDQSDADEVVVLLKRGQELMRYGDLAAARLVLRHAADAKNAEAALTLGATYDPVILRELRVYGLSADVGMARTWYEKAKELGSSEAARRLDNLGH